MALRPWEHQLFLEAVGRWSLRGVIGALGVASLVLAIGWVSPWPESELQPWAAQLALPCLLVAALVGLWPVRRLRRAADLDTRLGFGDRLATAWIYRDSSQSIATLQRSDAISRLKDRSARTELRWRPTRLEQAALAGVLLVALILLITPSPQQRVLDQQAAEQVAVQQASQRLDLLREQAAAVPSLTPGQAKQLNELLQQAQAELKNVKTQREATAIVARTADQLNQQLTDPNADLRDEALAAMSETLTAEPLTRSLGDALQHEDAQAASDAVQSLSAQADQLSDVQRQALSRALQRAANVGRSDSGTASALREAARALAAGESSKSALSAADAAIKDSIQASTAQAQLRDTTQQLRDLQAQLASGVPLTPDQSPPNGTGVQIMPTSNALGVGTPIALDAGGALLSDPGAGQGTGAGYGAAGQNASGAQAIAVGPAAENVFVPGRVGNGPADQDLTDQPFTVRGAPRPYRDVLGQYAQTGRDYVDRPDVSPAVRELVKQYFQQLEEGQ
ncbi:MAG TPA: hypothetical protein VKV73_12810 [Chloroflexota bacterium]|nr:hypothetical protein [Chloroflexota bacterium]